MHLRLIGEPMSTLARRPWPHNLRPVWRRRYNKLFCFVYKQRREPHLVSRLGLWVVTQFEMCPFRLEGHGTERALHAMYCWQ